MNSFTKRLLSALVAAGVLFSIWFYLGPLGLKGLITFAVVVGGFELIRILFKKEDSMVSKASFYVALLGIFAISTFLPERSGLAFACLAVLFCLINMFSQKKFQNLESLTLFEAKSVLGFFYLGLLPSFAARIVDLPKGTGWFLTLLAIVFAGDIGAYITGMLFGRHKLMPTISPKKTLEGSAGGLVFSILAGALCGHLLERPILPMILLSAVVAVIGQLGDLFESQLKRVANVKDSGRIMPGHGGVLDRIDGVLFACPILFLGALIIENQVL